MGPPAGKSVAAGHKASAKKLLKPSDQRLTLLQNRGPRPPVYQVSSAQICAQIQAKKTAATRLGLLPGGPPIMNSPYWDCILQWNASSTKRCSHLFLFFSISARNSYIWFLSRCRGYYCILVVRSNPEASNQQVEESASEKDENAAKGHSNKRSRSANQKTGAPTSSNPPTNNPKRAKTSSARLTAWWCVSTKNIVQDVAPFAIVFFIRSCTSPTTYTIIANL